MQFCVDTDLLVRSDVVICNVIPENMYNDILSVKITATSRCIVRDISATNGW